MYNRKILVILGPTAIGKTNLSIELAKKINGEIISCDSMQIYKGLDIGTNKVSIKIRKFIKHYFIDYCNIFKRYTVFNFQNDCFNIIEKIFRRNKVPIIVGGSCLYLQSVLEKYSFNRQNKDLDNKIYDYFLIALKTNRNLNYKLSDSRVDYMMKKGLLNEARYLFNIKKNIQPIHGIGYKEFFPYFNNKIFLNEVIYNIKKNSRRYIKRQMTWFNNKILINKWWDLIQFPKEKKKILFYIYNWLYYNKK